MLDVYDGLFCLLACLTFLPPALSSWWQLWVLPHLLLWLLPGLQVHKVDYGF